MSTQLELINSAIDKCPKEYLENALAPLSKLPDTCTKAEMLSNWLNEELKVYGIETYIGSNKNTILVDDKAMCRIIQVLKDDSYIPYISDEQLNRIKSLNKIAENNKVSIQWDQLGFRKVYYYVKQYGFHTVQLYNFLQLQTLATEAAALSATGAATLHMGAILVISWSGGMFFASLEPYIPNNMPLLKATVSGLKFVSSFPIRTSEYVFNSMTGPFEKRFIGAALPTNVTEVFKLNVGPELKNLKELRKPLIDWIIKKLK